uniref:Uncharacterized protein n=1 Tax=Arundo donax TaxID=35708 RepID=A0A0A8ZI63_ARUDO
MWLCSSFCELCGLEHSGGWLISLGMAVS